MHLELPHAMFSLINHVILSATSFSFSAAAIAIIAACVLSWYRYVFFRMEPAKPRLIYKDSTLAKHVFNNCQKLFTAPQPIIFFSNSHAQTLLSLYLPRTSDIQFTRQYILLKDKGIVAVDWGSTFKQNIENTLTKTSPVLLVLPGLLRDASHVTHICAKASDLGYRTVVFNKRGHGNARLSTPILQGYGDPKDVRQAIQFIGGNFPKCKISAVGYGDGADLLLSYLGEYGSSSYISGAVCISPMYDTEKHYNRGLGLLYENIFLWKHKQIIAKHSTALSSRKCLDFDKAMACTSLSDLEYTVFCEGQCQYSTLKGYWEEHSPMRDIDDISTPVLCINSTDDPVSNSEFIPYELFTECPNFMLALTNNGGHCGFLDGCEPELWADGVALEYLLAIMEFNQKCFRCRSKTR